VSDRRPPSRSASSVPFLFWQKRETSGKRPSTIIGQLAGAGKDLEYMRCSSRDASDNTQIYEGTNQIQCMVMARQLLK
jgi:hypothetical protein